MNNNSFAKIGLTLMVIQFFACTQSNNSKKVSSKLDTLVVWADTSLRVFCNEHKKAFENAGKPPFISLVFKNENEITAALLSHQIHAAFLQRNLSSAELNDIEKKSDFKPKQYAMAYDAFVLLSSNKNHWNNNSISIEEIEAILKGQSRSGFNLVLENRKALSIQFLKSQFKLNNQQLGQLYAKNNAEELFQFLKLNPQSIGIIPFSYISDVESEPIAEMLKGLQVLSISCLDSTQQRRSILPSQSSIATKEYPLITPVVFINSNMPFKSGINFVNYLYKPSAQRLVLKLGLCPAIFPGREIKINTK